MVNTLRPWPLTSAAHPVREAFEWLNQQPGLPHLTYMRVPIADETAPDDHDFDQLVTELRGAALAHAEARARGVHAPAGGGGRVAFLFNCHMGRGRTTTGMVCCSILMEAACGWQPPPNTSPATLPEPTAEGRSLSEGEYTSILTLLKCVDAAARPVYTPPAAAAGAATTPSAKERPQRPRLPPRRSSMRTILGHATLGRRAKLLADGCAQRCAHTQHLVSVMHKYSRQADAAEAGEGGKPANLQKAAFLRHRALKYLERYAAVLLFAAYALLAAGDGFEVTFSEWTRRHWQFKRAMKNMALESFEIRNEKGADTCRETTGR